MSSLVLVLDILPFFGRIQILTSTAIVFVSFKFYNPTRQTITITRECLLFLDYTAALIKMLLLEYEEDQGSLKNSIQDVRESMPAHLLLPLRSPAKKQQFKNMCLGLNSGESSFKGH